MAADNMSPLPQSANLFWADKARLAYLVCTDEEVSAPTELFEEIPDTPIGAYSAVIESK
ncbi:MAG TPA: hypothetical protein VNH18_18220 [Bryobacteraceae bacterium]|nr:hypothetical protein [Bryobacteraceae bacterium]